MMNWCVSVLLLPFVLSSGLRKNMITVAENPQPQPGRIARAFPPAGNGPLRVLFIGNSYTTAYYLPIMLQVMAAHEARPLQPEMLLHGSSTLQDHWNTYGAKAKINEGPWDFVILQEQSLRPLEEPTLFYQYGDLLAQEVWRSGGTPVFYMTWARQDNPKSQGQFSQVYRAEAERTGARLAPVGDARSAVQAANPEFELYEPDGSHPSAAGAYLAACVIYATLYGKSPVGLPGRVIAGDTILVQLADEDAAVLQTAAWAATAPYR